MEYTAFHGVFHDVPVDIILKEWETVYGKERVAGWIRMAENNHGNLDFTKEEVI